MATSLDNVVNLNWLSTPPSPAWLSEPKHLENVMLLSNITLPRDQPFACSHLREHSGLTDKPEMTPKGCLTNRSSKHSSAEQSLPVHWDRGFSQRPAGTCPSWVRRAHACGSWVRKAQRQEAKISGLVLHQGSLQTLCGANTASLHHQVRGPEKPLAVQTDRGQALPNCSCTILKTLLFHLPLVPPKRL